MTRQDRDLLIADNLAYVTAVLEEVRRHHKVTDALVFAGFSQGVAMAFRAACRLPARGTAVIAVGGDVPPEFDRDALARIPVALVGRGVRDEQYAEEKWQDDQSRLRAAGVDVRAMTFDCGHEWTGEVSKGASTLLARART
jgi:predicted esterase